MVQPIIQQLPTPDENIVDKNFPVITVNAESVFKTHSHLLEMVKIKCSNCSAWIAWLVIFRSSWELPLHTERRAFRKDHPIWMWIWIWASVDSCRSKSGLRVNFWISPNFRSRESTASSDEGKSAHKARFKATERKFAGLEEEKDEK